MQPMLATAAPPPGRPPAGPGWAHEVKWDGVRALVTVRDGTWAVTARTGRDTTVAYPELASLAAVPALARGTVLDGEVVLLADGRPSFTALADRMHVRDARRAAALAAVRPVAFVVFDVLRHDGQDLTGAPFARRREVLDAVGPALPGTVHVSPLYDDGEALWDATAQQGLEGVVSKRVTSSYRPGVRSPDWVKAPHRHVRTALVAGWRPESTGTGRLGAVLLVAPDASGALRYLGRAGSGLGGPVGRDLDARLRHAPAVRCPVADPVPAVDARGTVWVVPDVTVDVRYLTRTPSGRLRQPVVLGARTDADVDPWESR